MSSHADQPARDLARDPTVAARMEQLYERHAALVRSVCRALLRNGAEAEDAVQQTFLSAQRALVNGSSPRDAAAWLATIARHESLAQIKGRMREPLTVEIEEQDAAVPDAHAAALQRAEAGELREALAQLPLQQREAILLRELRGLSYQEVAATLSVTTSAVESLLFRARRTLQTRLQEALAALSPAWLQSLRQHAAELASGGAAAPAAAKVAAVGVGTALFAGGALGPTVLGLGPARPSGRHASQPAPHHAVRAVSPKAPMQLWSQSASVLRTTAHPQARAPSRESEGSGGTRPSDRSERESATVAASSGDGGDRGAYSSEAGSSADSSSGSDDRSTDDGGSHTTSTATTTTDTTTSTSTTVPVTTTDD